MVAQDKSVKISNFVSREVQAVTDLMQALATLDELHGEYQNNGYSGVITQDHILGDNAHMTPALVANVFTSFLAIAAFMETNFHDDVLAQASR